MATLNAKVLQWASAQVGKQIGAGECWDLANSALGQAGAGTSSDFGPMGADDDYIWGDEVALKDALPGDILQYRDYEMTTTTTTDPSAWETWPGAWPAPPRMPCPPASCARARWR